MNSPKLCEKISRSQSIKKNQNHKSSLDEIDQDQDESSPSQILERVKPDRVTATKPEEDRRRRTIIVEKKNGTYGFTLQSYGIHYKKEREIEMITYVDYVEYDGPAYRAGMREGDVILSINGHDMEKADHKMLVNFIQHCEARMRMVVLFEDCVRKVELHIRYIQIQRVIQNKMTELDKLCLKERELLLGKWKTYSLPARKKGANSESRSEDKACRPTVSTEDVAKAPPQPQQLLLYQYLDPRYQYVLQPGTNSNEYLITWNQKESNQRLIVKANCEIQARHNTAKGYHQTNGVAAATSNINKSRGFANMKAVPNARHLCNPCIQANNNQDNNSLEAYDLASPCCDTHCVPSTKRRSRQHKHRNGHSKSQSNIKQQKDTTETFHEVTNTNREPKENQPSKQNHAHHRSNKYFSFGSNLVSQCSIHSCTSSELSNAGVQDGGESSAVSYSTSLSTDTLYWDTQENTSNNRQHSTKSNQSSRSRNSGYYSQQHSCRNEQAQGYTEYVSKPKSWDNLTTKAFGGYGFGYGYLDASSKTQNSGYTTSSSTMPSSVKNHNRSQTVKVNARDSRLQGTGIRIYHVNHHYTQPMKSSENLLLKYDPTLSDSSISCDCLDLTSPHDEKQTRRFFTSSNNSLGQAGPSGASTSTEYHRDKGIQTRKNNVGEVTRL